MRYSTLVRAAWGLSLLLAPGTVIRGIAREPADHAARVVGRILGARHLVQALVVERTGTRGWLLVSAGIDATHALSMVGLAALSRRHRRPAALDAAVAAGWTLNGLREAQNA